VAACDAYGVMLIQPSGEHEGAFSGGGNTTLKAEIHRDMIIRDRNNPSILAWEVSNGPIGAGFAQQLKAISVQWDPIHTRAQADRTPSPACGDILACTLTGCEIGVKNQFPNNPAWGAEAWGKQSARFAYDHELAFAGEFIQNWRKSIEKNCFGLAQWYLAETPGETGNFVEGTNNVRSFGSSMLDFNRIPKLLYYIYRAAWVPFSIKPNVRLAHHWNRSGNVRVNAFSNCPTVRLLLNGTNLGQKTPNPWNGTGTGIDQNTTQLPFQCWWDVTWQSGTLRAEGLDASGNVVCFDERKTAGAPDHVVLAVEPPLVKPDGDTFKICANGSDAALILATVVDANGTWCPTANNLITWSVSSLGRYLGGSDQLVTAG
jgi:beta-galactosidase